MDFKEGDWVRILKWSWKGSVCQIVSKSQGAPCPAWNVKLPSGRIGMFFENELQKV